MGKLLRGGLSCEKGETTSVAAVIHERSGTLARRLSRKRLRGHRYLHSIHHPEKPFEEVRVTLSPTRRLAETFDRLASARAYGDVLSTMDGVAEFCVVL